MSDQTKATGAAPQPPHRETLVSEDAWERALQALDTLNMIDDIRKLSPDESERVHAEIQRALHRMKSPQALETFLILESFRAVMDGVERNEPAAHIRQWHGITSEELRAYRGAWQTISRIHHAAQARAEQEEGEAGLDQHLARV